MADQQPSANGDGSAEINGDTQVSIIAQYVKDLSVENPSAPQVFQWQVQPKVDVQFNISVAAAGEDVHEVTLKIEVSGRSDNGVHFIVDLSYAGLYVLRGIPDEALQPFLLIEAPRLLFPFARQIVAEAISNTGFAPLLLDPIDFANAYLQQLEAQQGASATANGDAGAIAEEPGAEDLGEA
ncbi:MAG: protein-export chaperone SecB [Sphingomicrobium sp.]